jgi:succinate dehydrogenase / fumarate reductase cytochrome b subunit
MPSVLYTLRHYKSLPGMVAWIMQRLTGLGLALFLLVHIFSIHRLVGGPEAFQEELKLYGNPFFKISEIGLGLMIFSHAFNGLRILAFDWLPRRSDSHRRILWAMVVLFVLIAIPVALLMVKFWLFR